MRKPRKLTLQQQRFCDEYLYCNNASTAMERAGYPKTSIGNTTRLLNNPAVQAYLEERRNALQQKHEITLDMVVRELGLMAFADYGDYVKAGNDGVDISQLPPDKRRAIASVRQYVKGRGKDAEYQTCIKLQDKIKALMQLGKHLGLYAKPNPHALVKGIIINGLVPDPPSGEDEDYSK